MTDIQSNTTLESFTWFQAIHTFCHPIPTDNGDMDLEEDEEPPLGPEGDLIPEMVSRAVVPLLVKALESGAYDPYSAPQTRRAVDLTDVISELTGKDSRKFTVSRLLSREAVADRQSFLKAILMVYHNHITDLVASVQQAASPSAIPAPAFDPASRTSMERFVRRRLKLVKNILLMRRQSPNEARELITRIVNDVLRPVLEKAWGGGGREMGLKVIKLMLRRHS
jgi:GC-rich sequence DNA-binding factor